MMAFALVASQTSMACADEQAPAIARTLGWFKARFKSVAPVGHTVDLWTPVPLSQIFDDNVPAVDVAHCTYFGWHQYENQHKVGEIYVADLSHQLRTSDYRNFSYHVENHRLVAVQGHRGVFEGLLNMVGKEGRTCTNRLEFRWQKSRLVARVIQTRSDDRKHPFIARLECVHS